MKRVTSAPAERGKITVPPNRKDRPLYHKPGKPQYEPSDIVREWIMEMRGAGFTEAKIARLIINPRTGNPLDVLTLKKHYARELEIGLDQLNWNVSNSAMKQALGFPGVPNPNYGRADKRKKIDGVKNPNYNKIDNKRWLTPPVAPVPSMTIWWEKTRAGMKEGVSIEHSGPGGGPIQTINQTVIILPPNGRETGGTPMLADAEYHEVEDDNAPAKKANGSGSTR